MTKFSGHKKKINGVAFHPDFNSSGLVFSASSDQTMKVWRGADKGSKGEIVWTYNEHNSEVQGVAVHPSGNYALTYTMDGHWSFVSINHQSCIKMMQPASK